ncbi:MAG: CRISPR-associated endonuclease Cas2 [Hyphomonadaceae bacterium]|nr:CRISPR-associated endonuclease Cas2 [Clostridia bacterium]
MRLLVFFDLPVGTKEERKIATRFRKFVLEDGYMMVQFSVYCRICNGQDAVNKHLARLNGNLPKNGSVRCLQITDKQYGNMKFMAGEISKTEKKMNSDQLSMF